MWFGEGSERRRGSSERSELTAGSLAVQWLPQAAVAAKGSGLRVPNINLEFFPTGCLGLQ